MNIKKSYNVGDPAWVYGISRTNNKLTKGRVLHIFNLTQAGYSNEKYYLVEIPCEIDPLLEVRTWQSMSQDSRGPVGAFREQVAQADIEPVNKKLSQMGLTVDDEWFEGDGHDGMGTTLEEFDRYEEHMAEDGDPTPEQIHAAMERAKQTSTHPPLNLKEAKPKRRNFTRKKKV
jgi:hypothetical protein